MSFSCSQQNKVLLILEIISQTFHLRYSCLKCTKLQYLLYFALVLFFTSFPPCPLADYTFFFYLFLLYFLLYFFLFYLFFMPWLNKRKLFTIILVTLLIFSQAFEVQHCARSFCMSFLQHSYCVIIQMTNRKLKRFYLKLCMSLYHHV